ncbi:MAG: hypothetical protein H6Q37_244 [Chloroflexi bacterium]|nr:hypothetical protein [Chloroflexota bacterium]
MTETHRVEFVRELAYLLFDQTQSLHELDESNRQVLGMAASMIDDYQNLAKKKAVKTIQRMLKTTLGDSLSPEGVELLATVLALQADLVGTKYILKSELSPIQQRAVLTLAALLKIAAALDASETQTTAIVRVEPARDEMWIEISGPNEQVDGVAAESAAQLWEKIGYPKISVLEHEEARRIRDSHAQVPDLGPVTPSDTQAEAGRKVMSQQFLAVLRYEDGTRQGEDIEALHDMRVATRRLRAAFDVFGDAYRPKTLKRLLKHLRATGRALGRVRDLDVFMQKAQNYISAQSEQNGQSGLEPLLQAWQAQREQARAEMLVYLDSKEYQTFKNSFVTFLNTPDAGDRPTPKGNPTPNLVRELAPAMIYDRLAAVRSFDRVIPDAPVEQLHALRIEFKKLRYTFEYFRDVLGPQADGIINEFKGLQDHLGDLNDAQVAIGILQEFLKSRAKKSKGGSQLQEAELQAISAYQVFRQEERDQLMNSFPAAWAHFNRPEFMLDIALAVSVL